MKVHVEKPQKPNVIVPLIVIVLIGAAIFLLMQLFPKPSSPLAYEVVSHEGEVQIMNPTDGSWHEPKRGEEVSAGQKIRTNSEGLINLQVENEIKLRLKGEATLSNQDCKLQSGKQIYKLNLEKGVLFGATTKPFDRKVEKGSAHFTVSTPAFDVVPSGALFRIHASDKADENSVGVLRGSAEIFKDGLFFKPKVYRIRGLEKSSLIEGKLQAPVKVSPEEWQDLKEGYDLLSKSAAMEAEQIDLSKAAGDFFKQVVFDHGTFFTPKMGYAGRDFFKDANSGEVYLETEYDVYPPGSFVGVYLKTRDFDISKYDGLLFDARRRGEEGYPDSFLIELKSKGNVIRRFSARGFTREWLPIDFKFNANKSTPVNEVVFVFTNDRVGETKKGMLEFRNFNLTPRKTPLPAQLPSALAPKPVATAAAAVTPIFETKQPTAQKQNAVNGDNQSSSSDVMVPQTISLR